MSAQPSPPRASNGARGARLVVVLHSAVAADAAADDQDGLAQVEAVCAALSALGHRVLPVAFGEDLAGETARLGGLAPALVFNLVECVGGTLRLTHLAPGILDALRIPYTGCDASALLVTGDKLVAKRMLRGAGIATPGWLEPDGTLIDADAGAQFIVKSVHEDASLGIDATSIVDGATRARRVMASRAARHGGTWFAEVFVDGREFNASVIGPRDAPEVLPIPEIEFIDYPDTMPRIVDWDAKWVPESHGYSHTPRRFDLPASDAPLLERLAAASMACWRLFGLSGYARVDFRVGADGAPMVLEVNANPCIAPDAGLAAAAQRAGLDYPALVARVLSFRTAHGGRAAA